MFAKNRKSNHSISDGDFNFYGNMQDAHQRPQRVFRLFNLTAAFLTLALLCAGCGGSSSSESSGATVNGVVADGYLSGARVFLDLNNNRHWDAGEPHAMSGADGSYSISDITVADDDGYPMVAEVTVTTTDQDTGKPASHPYTLVSPAGHPEFISPLTTMVQVSYESNPGITLDQAQAAVKEILSMEDETDVDLFADYVREKEGGGAPAAYYSKLHNIAKLSARLLGANISAIESAAGTAGITVEEAKAEILRIAVKTIMQYMDLIEDIATGETDFDADQEVQVLDIQVDTDNIAADIAAEAMAVQYQAPSLRWGAIFRSHDSGGSTDVLCLALEHDLDLTGYSFSAEGPGGAEYVFNSEDLYSEPAAPIAWAKSISDLPAGEYTFYVTVPGGEKVALARDTHVHTVIPALSMASSEVISIDGPMSRVYHDTLDGPYYYRMLIRDSVTNDIVYRTKRRERNIQYFPSEYTSAGYQYRLEVWDKPVLEDATARYRTAWTDINPSGAATDTYVEFYKGYRRIRYREDGSPSNRLVLQIGVTNPDNISSLTITDPASNQLYDFNLSVAPGETVNDGVFYFTRMSGTTEDGAEYGDYFLQVFDTTPNGTYTWHADVIAGADITRSVTIYDQTALPCVNPDLVSATENQYGDITVAWDPVDWSGKPIFYRVAIVKGEDWDNEYHSVRTPACRWTGTRDAIESVIGGSLDDTDVAISIWVLDSQYASTVHNRTDFAPVQLIID